MGQAVARVRSVVAGGALLMGPALAAAQPSADEQPQEIRIDGHKAVRARVTTARELQTLLALTDDVLTCSGIPREGTIDVRMSPEQYQALVEMGLAHEVLIEDMQAQYDAWRAENERIRMLPAAPVGAGAAHDGPNWYDAFRDLAEIEDRLEDLAAAFPGLATLSTIGTSVEGRPILMIRITGPGSTADRPAIVVNGTQHAREALTPMVTTFLAEHLLMRYASDPAVQVIVDGIDMYIVPVVNPDGYEHARTVNWWWRKNRSTAHPYCPGVDLNRNWGFQWGLEGSSPDACSDTYRGPSRFSEPETQALAAVIDQLGRAGRLRGHIDIHSAAQRFLSPWGWTTSPPAHLPTMNTLGNLMRSALAGHRGLLYQVAQSVTLSMVSGGATDYSYGNFGAMSWTMELSGPGFYPPPTEIVPVGHEVVLALSALAEVYLPRATGAGACCIPSGCHLTNSATCAQLGGEFAGIGTTCAQRVCPYFYATAAANTVLLQDGAGVFLDITADTLDVIVRTIEYRPGVIGGAPVQVDVLVREGSYVGHDEDPAGWSLHTSFAGVSQAPAPDRITLNPPLRVPAGETVGIYLVANEGQLRVTSTGAQPFWWGRNLRIFSNRSRTALWGGTPAEHTFSGTIFYALETPACYANCDGSAATPILTVDDFTCFINAYAEALGLPHEQQIPHYANCDGSTLAPVLNVDDFTCFINAFAQGCS